MKTSLRLILMRHAKSDWSHDMSDHDRPLNDRGRRDAPRIGKHLKDLGWQPDLVLCSTAARTRETLAGMEALLAPHTSVHFQRSLYLAGLGDLQDAVASLATPDHRTILALGHNPGWEMAASVLANQSLYFTTANAALIELAGSSWEEAMTSQAGRLVHLIRPKEL